MNQILYSIIVCTCNRPGLLKTALESLSKLKTNQEFTYELHVVDNSPNRSLNEIVSSLKPIFSGNLYYHCEPKQGKSFALNHGIKQSKGNILVFTDDDIIAEENWLIILHQKFQLYACDGIGGRVLPVYPKETPQWVKDNAVKLAGGVVIYDYGENDFPLTSDQYAFIGANYAFKREVFQECGLFRTDMGPGTPVMGEDTDITERFLKSGKKLYYCGQVVIWHPFDPERIRLKHMAKWHISLGRYSAIKEIENKVKITSYFCHVPRYLWKGILTDFLKLTFSVFDRMAFLNAWRAFFRKLGMIQHYRLISKQ